MEEQKKELVGLNMIVTKTQRNELKVLAALNGKTMTETFTEMLEDYKRKNGANK
jgi:hypothetical protein